MSERPKQRYATPTADLLSRWQREPNPVTRSVLAQIIGRRIDRIDAAREQGEQP